MAFSLNDLINDGRLERLFSKCDRDCALQLWILQMKSSDCIESRLVMDGCFPTTTQAIPGTPWMTTILSQLESIRRKSLDLTCT